MNSCWVKLKNGEHFGGVLWWWIAGIINLKQLGWTITKLALGQTRWLVKLGC
jgi:hypothetical protein